MFQVYAELDGNSDGLVTLEEIGKMQIEVRMSHITDHH